MWIQAIGILLCFFLLAANATWAQWNKRYSLQIPTGNLEEAVQQLAHISKKSISYDAQLLKQFTISAKKFEQESLKDILEQLIENKPLNYIQSVWWQAFQHYRRYYQRGQCAKD
jgi:hypothetical protein